MNKTNTDFVVATLSPVQLYTTAEKTLLPLVILPCALVCFLMYRLGKRPLHGNQTLDGRLINWYSAAAGGILGQFFFHTLPNSTIQAVSTNYAAISIFVFLGFFAMIALQKCIRVHNENTYYTGPNAVAVEIRHTVNQADLTQNDYFQASELETQDSTGVGTAFAQNMWAITDEAKEIKSRQLIAILLFFILMFVSVFEGIFLVYNFADALGGGPVLVLMFYVNKLTQTTILCIVQLYAILHVANTRSRISKYTMISAFWCVVISTTTLPVLVDVNPAETETILNNTATSIFYAVAGGIMFWIALRFIWIDRRQTNKKDTTIRLVVFFLFAAVAYMTGFFT